MLIDTDSTLYLDQEKTDSSKRRRIQLKHERTVDAQYRKLWSNKHGHDTYGSDDSDIDKDELKRKGQKKRTTGETCKCGSTTHLRTNHSECPLNMKNHRGGVSVDDRASDNYDYSEDTLSDAESISLENSVPAPTSDTSWCFEDDVKSGICVCRALGRAHKRDCPSNSRNRHVGCTLFPKASSAD